MIPMLDATIRAAQSSRRIPTSITANSQYNADNVRYVKFQFNSQCVRVSSFSWGLRWPMRNPPQSSFEVPMRDHITLSPKQLGLAMLFVALGGGVGTLIRDLLLKINLYAIPRGTAVYPSTDWTHQIPWVLLIINTVGVFVATDLLVIVFSTTIRMIHATHLFTGFLGGLTSYSGLFVDLAAIAPHHRRMSFGGRRGHPGGLFAGCSDWVGIGAEYDTFANFVAGAPAVLSGTSSSIPSVAAIRRVDPGPPSLPTRWEPGSPVSRRTTNWIN